MRHAFANNTLFEIQKAPVKTEAHPLGLLQLFMIMAYVCMPSDEALIIKFCGCILVAMQASCPLMCTHTDSRSICAHPFTAVVEKPSASLHYLHHLFQTLTSSQPD